MMNIAFYCNAVVVMRSVVFLNDAILSFVKPSANILGVIMLSVAEPLKTRPPVKVALLGS
jgi:hypothetical protein